MRALYHTTIHWIGSTPCIFFLIKHCNTCHQDLEFDKFSVDKGQKDGISGRCCECRSNQWTNRGEEEKQRERTQRKAAEDLRREGIREYDRLRRSSRLRVEKAKEQEQELWEKMSKGELIQLTLLLPTHKLCTRCDPPIPKALSEFTINPGAPDGHHSICKTCCNTYAHTKLGQRREREKKRKLTDLAYMRQLRREKRLWDRTHPIARRERTLRHQAKKKTTCVEPVSYTHILERDGRFCHICQQNIDEGYPLEFDHVIPLARGGAHAESNIKVSHRICNRVKSDRLLEELSPLDFERMRQEISLYYLSAS